MRIIKLYNTVKCTSFYLEKTCSKNCKENEKGTTSCSDVNCLFRKMIDSVVLNFYTRNKSESQFHAIKEEPWTDPLSDAKNIALYLFSSSAEEIAVDNNVQFFYLQRSRCYILNSIYDLFTLGYRPSSLTEYKDIFPILKNQIESAKATTQGKMDEENIEQTLKLARSLLHGEEPPPLLMPKEDYLFDSLMIVSYILNKAHCTENSENAEGIASEEELLFEYIDVILRYLCGEGSVIHQDAATIALMELENQLMRFAYDQRSKMRRLVERCEELGVADMLTTLGLVKFQCDYTEEFDIGYYEVTEHLPLLKKSFNCAKLMGIGELFSVEYNMGKFYEFPDIY
ncbi:uncharacterized protein MONOS_3789 [Monocercomonoides exilis]|uniref:uncharacterized protein n=1 Tax=Monocercomonoides exilis TaxID=2049356 RepID=UPI00355A2B07|nr:hypothetical protein MONOS_3789 [Monocercomonoides exilis]|eukprot:MONOS_3789.1-p1 / transcript=MONOS_3789.1 / gene=MONOS_3789 / organism=Monocercomonoides_exilis_PA203 / gene_product=unspecified product / transcript_product=unspecified product / location=Mono_scaffold00092:114045-115070(-) / protein_length=342 / sequence_SO=supercontig / SO=protein_coding / is_pseudo=false